MICVKCPVFVSSFFSSSNTPYFQWCPHLQPENQSAMFSLFPCSSHTVLAGRGVFSQLKANQMVDGVGRDRKYTELGLGRGHGTTVLVVMLQDSNQQTSSHKEVSLVPRLLSPCRHTNKHSSIVDEVAWISFHPAAPNVLFFTYYCCC